MRGCCSQFVTAQGSSACSQSFGEGMGSFRVLSPVPVTEGISSALRQRQGLQGTRRDLLCKGQEGDFRVLLPFLKGMQIREAAAIRLPASGRLLWSLFCSPWGFDEGKLAQLAAAHAGRACFQGNWDFLHVQHVAREGL